MIHTIYTMSIGRFGQLEKTQDARLLRLWWNPLPVRLFRKRIDIFFQSVAELWTEDGFNSQLNDQVERAYMINKMLQMSIIYDALYALMVIKAGIDITLLMLDRDPKESKNLQYYKDQVKELTGIDIQDIADIAKLRDEMTRMSDKFKERFPDEEPSDEKPSFTRAALGIFSIMEMPYNERMTMAEFAELKKLAEERTKQLEKQLDKYGATGWDSRQE